MVNQNKSITANVKFSENLGFTAYLFRHYPMPCVKFIIFFIF